MNIQTAGRLIVSLGLPLAAGIIGSVFTASAIPTWYADLVKPDFSPPNWLFAPVWTTLYILMGIAVFLVWSKGLEKRSVKGALFIFGIQLVLNTLWSVLFFGLQNPGLAFGEIMLLFAAILVNIVIFYKVSRVAAYLLLPYIVWVGFAAYLNYVIWMLNK